MGWANLTKGPDKPECFYAFKSGKMQIFKQQAVSSWYCRNAPTLHFPSMHISRLFDAPFSHLVPSFTRPRGEYDHPWRQNNLHASKRRRECIKNTPLRFVNSKTFPKQPFSLRKIELNLMGVISLVPEACGIIVFVCKSFHISILILHCTTLISMYLPAPPL